MHEVSLLQDAIEIAEEQAQAKGARRIDKITLRVGRLAGVDPEALAFAFEVVARGTLAEGAKLIVEDVPVVCHCTVCEMEFQPEGWAFECPHCGQVANRARKGGNLELASLEV